MIKMRLAAILVLIMTLQYVAVSAENITVAESPDKETKRSSYYANSKSTSSREPQDMYRESRRELRGRGGGRSSSRSSSSRSSYYRSYTNFNSATFKSYRYSYTSYKSPLTTVNGYWNA